MRAESPDTVRAPASGRAERSRPRRLAAPAAAGGEGASRSISSIGVTSTTWFPYSPTDSEMAPMFRRTPFASRHMTGEPEKPSAMPVASTAGPEARTRMRGPPRPVWPPITSMTSTSNCEICVPRITERPTQSSPGAPATAA